MNKFRKKGFTVKRGHLFPSFRLTGKFLRRGSFSLKDVFLLPDSFFPKIKKMETSIFLKTKPMKRIFVKETIFFEIRFRSLFF